MNGCVTCREGLYFQWGMYTLGTQDNLKLKFSNMQIYLTITNAIFEYCPASLNLKKLDVLYLEDGDVYRPVLNIKTATLFLLQKPFLVIFCFAQKYVRTLPNFFKDQILLM